MQCLHCSWHAWLGMTLPPVPCTPCGYIFMEFSKDKPRWLMMFKQGWGWGWGWRIALQRSFTLKKFGLYFVVVVVVPFYFVIACMSHFNHHCYNLNMVVLLCLFAYSACLVFPALSVLSLFVAPTLGSLLPHNNRHQQQQSQARIMWASTFITMKNGGFIAVVFVFTIALVRHLFLAHACSCSYSWLCLLLL